MIDVTELLDQLDALYVFTARYYPSWYDGPQQLKVLIDELRTAPSDQQRAAIRNLKNFVCSGMGSFFDVALVPPDDSPQTYAALAKEFEQIGDLPYKTLQDIWQWIEESE